MKYLLNTEKSLLALALALAVSTTSSVANEEESTEVDIQACFELEYSAEDITSQTAYDIAECFSGLADNLVESDSDEFVADGSLWLWDDKNVLLHYADSWFSYAAFKGHPEAAEQLKETRDAFQD